MEELRLASAERTGQRAYIDDVLALVALAVIGAGAAGLTIDLDDIAIASASSQFDRLFWIDICSIVDSINDKHPVCPIISLKNLNISQAIHLCPRALSNFCKYDLGGCFRKPRDLCSPSLPFDVGATFLLLGVGAFRSQSSPVRSMIFAVLCEVEASVLHLFRFAGVLSWVEG